MNGETTFARWHARRCGTGRENDTAILEELSDDGTAGAFGEKNVIGAGNAAPAASDTATGRPTFAQWHRKRYPERYAVSPAFPWRGRWPGAAGSDEVASPSAISPTSASDISALQDEKARLAAELQADVPSDHTGTASASDASENRNTMYYPVDEDTQNRILSESAPGSVAEERALLREAARRNSALQDQVLTGMGLDGAGKRQELTNLQTAAETIARRQEELNRAEGIAPPPELSERASKFLTGTGRQTVSGYVNAAATLLDAANWAADRLDDYYAWVDSAFGDSTLGKAAQFLLVPASMGAKDIPRTPSVFQERIIPAMQEAADDLAVQGERDMSRAQEGLGWGGRLLMDVGSSGLQMAGDAALNLALPGLGLASLGTRAFGSAAQEARQGGADLLGQMGYGSAVAAVEVLTEKLLDLMKVYNGGTLDDFVKDTINRLTGNAAARLSLQVLAGAAGESLEELLSGLLEPSLKSIYDGKDPFSHYDRETKRELLHDMLVGGVLGAIGTGTQVGANRINERIGNAILSDTGAKNAIFQLYKQNPDNPAWKAAAEMLTNDFFGTPFADPEKVGELYLQGMEEIAGETDNQVEEGQNDTLQGQPLSETPQQSRLLRSYVDEFGGFRHEDLFSDYRNELKNMPEYYRMPLEEALSHIRVEETDDPETIFGIKAKQGMLQYNPRLIRESNLDMQVVMTHELAHWIDCNRIKAWENQAFKQSVWSMEDVIAQNPEFFIQYCDEHDKSGLLTDLLDAGCGGAFLFYGGHGSKYWKKNPVRRQTEVFANLYTAYATENRKIIRFLRRYFPDLIDVYEKQIWILEG